MSDIYHDIYGYVKSITFQNMPLVRPSEGTSLGGTSCYNITTPACLRMLHGFNPNTAAQVNATNGFGIIGVYTEQLLSISRPIWTHSSKHLGFLHWLAHEQHSCPLTAASC